MIEVSTQEEEVLILLDSGGDYSDVLEEYDEGEELIESLDDKDLLGSESKGFKAGISGRAQKYLNGKSQKEQEQWQDEYPELREEEIMTLYGTLAGASRSDIADFLDVSRPTVSNYRGKLVDEDYLRNLQPGRGPSDYIPGAELIKRMNDYSPEPCFLEGLDPAQPFEEVEDIRWLIGESLYKEIQESKEDIQEDVQDEIFEEDEASIEPALNGHREASAVNLLKIIKEGDSGFGIISDKIDNAHGIVETLEDGEIVEESRETVSGIKLTEKGERYLEEAETEDPTESRETHSGKNSRNSSRRSTSKRRPDSKADDNLQDLGEKLLGGHRETIEQEEDIKRDFTDGEAEEVDIEDDDAGYEGFT